MLKESAWLLRLLGDKAPPTARYGSGVACAQRQFCCPEIRNDRLSWCLSSYLSLSVGFSIKDEASDVARSAQPGPLPCGRYFLASLTGT